MPYHGPRRRVPPGAGRALRRCRMRFELWRRPRGRSGVWVAVVTAAAALVLLGSRAARHGSESGRSPFARVERGDLEIEVASVGELDAVRSLTFGVPRLRGSSAKV